MEQTADAHGAAHPRSRGENASIDAKAAELGGSSPLTRGKLGLEYGGDGLDRLIPAHAGKTAIVALSAAHATAHPRSRGENPGSVLSTIPVSGSSPLTRGKLVTDSTGARRGRLIPAHAGKTVWGRLVRPRRPAHPRSRGENGIEEFHERKNGGSSPLTRGKHRLAVLTQLRERLIPAHAGKTSIGLPTQVLGFGSSPLTRGKRPRHPRPLPELRLIPAHAGKTLPDLRFYRADRSDLGKP